MVGIVIDELEVQPTVFKLQAVNEVEELITVPIPFVATARTS